jgi:hypothetical protein
VRVGRVKREEVRSLGWVSDRELQSRRAIIPCVSPCVGRQSPKTATWTNSIIQTTNRNANHGTARLVVVVEAPDSPCFHAYFKPPRMRSSRGLTSFPVAVRIVSALSERFNTTDLATRGDPRLCHDCHLA